MTWRVIRSPDRWAIVASLLEPPARRPGLEFCVVRPRSTIARSFPVHVVPHRLGHLSPDVLEIDGTLIAVRDRESSTVTVRCRISAVTGQGRMIGI
jgi:hypothetical protein